MTTLALNSRVTRGTIGYRNHRDELVGKEQFAINYGQHGMTLDARCELQEYALQRHVNIAMNDRWLPTHGDLSLKRQRKFLLNSEFAVSNEQIKIHNQRAGEQSIEQAIPNTPGIKHLGLHPLQGDALITKQLPNILRANKYYSIPAVTNSVSENGVDDKQASLLNIAVAYSGIEPVKVAAGQFIARRYKLCWHPKWPPAYLWTMVDEPIFLKMVWPQVPYWYELMEVEKATPAMPEAANASRLPTHLIQQLAG
ncbi:hypothetical protein [Alteromonas lipolytica]|uniref:Uncharacterized protein n=1 Tax=Alteromonas lipolytica TaxID=1856405 RepID=A0A1E8FBR5_9ALTE|nr:hypothetical protein [Alteromonas lipolytica]OFI33355.1 hypothetical protein BFC17_03580 [Alteromonas lipolytica]GGF60450.1 hypothetical protein GCM10011338_10860 [Alteromonas lipolytica]